MKHWHLHDDDGRCWGDYESFPRACETAAHHNYWQPSKLTVVEAGFCIEVCTYENLYRCRGCRWWVQVDVGSSAPMPDPLSHRPECPLTDELDPRMEGDHAPASVH